MAISGKRWKIIDWTASGDTTLVSGVAGQSILLKNIIMSIDSGTTIQFKNSSSRVLTCKFYFGAIGGLTSTQPNELNIHVGVGLDLVLNSSNAVNGSIMFEWGFQVL